MNPIVANNRPAKVDLKEGEKYYFCMCGLSKSQPFCDGSHVGTEFKPKALPPKNRAMPTCASANIQLTCPIVMVLISNLIAVPWVKKDQAFKQTLTNHRRLRPL